MSRDFLMFEGVRVYLCSVHVELGGQGLHVLVLLLEVHLVHAQLLRHLRACHVATVHTYYVKTTRPKGSFDEK